MVLWRGGGVLVGLVTFEMLYGVGVWGWWGIEVSVWGGSV